MENRDENFKKLQKFLEGASNTPRGCRYIINNISKNQQRVEINENLLFRRIETSDIRRMHGAFINEFETKDFSLEDIFLFEHLTEKYNAYQEHDILKYACSILETPILFFAEDNAITTFEPLSFQIFSIVNREHVEKDYSEVELRQLADILKIFEFEQIPDQVFGSFYFYLNSISNILDKEFKFVSLITSLETLFIHKENDKGKTLAEKLSSLNKINESFLNIKINNIDESLFDLMRNLYRIRNPIIHGNKRLVDRRLREYKYDNFNNTLETLNYIVRKTLLKVIYDLDAYKSVYSIKY